MSTLEAISLSRQERLALAAAVQALKDHFPVEQVLLFGSRARGEGNAESDLDILVLTTREMTWIERRAVIDALFDIELAHDVLLSPLIVSGQEWRQGPYRILPIHDEIARDGVVV
jgi:predicted nucleotidyltransferase